MGTRDWCIRCMTRENVQIWIVYKRRAVTEGIGQKMGTLPFFRCRTGRLPDHFLTSKKDNDVPLDQGTLSGDIPDASGTPGQEKVRLSPRTRAKMRNMRPCRLRAMQRVFLPVARCLCHMWQTQCVSMSCVQTSSAPVLRGEARCGHPGCADVLLRDWDSTFFGDHGVFGYLGYIENVAPTDAPRTGGGGEVNNDDF